MLRRSLSLALPVVLAALAAACDSGNPVAPAPPDGGGSSSATYSISLSASPAEVPAGSTQGATITATVRRLADGSAPANGTSLTMNTSVGSFGVTSQGDPVQTVSLSLVGGQAQAQFLPGDDTGTATLLATLGDSTGRLTLSIVEPGTAPTAAFSVETNNLDAIFTDASTGEPTSWSWDFGDGRSSTAASPTHRYPDEGTYTATLTVANENGSDTVSHFVTITLGDPPKAAFSAETNGLEVLFLDASTGDPDLWSWQFGDGATSSGQNPTHTYAAPGTYAVTLTVANQAGTSSTQQFVTVSLGTAPKASFTVQTSGLLVQLSDTSTGSPTAWSWDFGDGATSTQQNPAHTYAAAGTYTVTLTAGNAAGSSSASQLVTVSLGTPPTAAFEVQTNGLSAIFTDASTGSPTSWLWDFGDHSGSTAQSPTHTYAAPGTYTVTLTATNDAGSTSASQFVTVSAGTAPVADFTAEVSDLSVLFTDQSTGSPTAWSWDFGDGATSAQQNPAHTYAAAGTYTVTLTATNAAGSGTRSRFVTVGASP